MIYNWIPLMAKLLCQAPSVSTRGSELGLVDPASGQDIVTGQDGKSDLQFHLTGATLAFI